MTDFVRVRRAMVDNQLRTYDITDIEVLSAMNRVPREHFVPPERLMLAYTDNPLVVAETADGPRAMLPPMVFARMIQELVVRPGMRVLDVAGGLGYSSAVMATMGAKVTLLESDERLVGAAAEKLRAIGHEDIEVVHGPLERGYLPRAPYDAIVINGCLQVRPEGVLEQLVEEGRLACIMGNGDRTSRVMLFVRSGDVFGSRTLFDAAAPILPPFRVEPGFVF